MAWPFSVRAPMAFRTDSLSLAAAAASWAAWTPPRWLGPAAQLAVGSLAFVPLRRAGAAGLLLASALAVSASFLCWMQAFSNYYYFAVAQALIAVVMLPPHAGTPAE